MDDVNEYCDSDDGNNVIEILQSMLAYEYEICNDGIIVNDLQKEPT